jgi:hypothetical protein
VHETIPYSVCKTDWETGIQNKGFRFTASRDVDVSGRKFDFPQAMILLALPCNSHPSIDAEVVCCYVKIDI